MQNKQRFMPIYILFFISGIPPLIYQIVWQRALNTIYGVNIESLTVIIAAFMLGLGLGSLLGGILSKTKFIPHLVIFGLLELGISLFGYFSLEIFNIVGRNTLGASTFPIFIYSFCVVLFPTLLMGATLPILSEYLISKFKNIGRSVGILYAVNTLGSSASCFLTAAILLNFLGKDLTVKTAVFVNFVVGLGAIIYHFMKTNQNKINPNKKEKKSDHFNNINVADNNETIPIWISFILAMIIAFISISYEIVWTRLYSFLAGGAANAFPLLLGCFLAGIGFGSLFCGKYLTEKPFKSRKIQLIALAFIILIANLIAFLTIPFIKYMVAEFSWPVTFPLIVFASSTLGATFPLLCHLSIKPNKFPGEKLSYIYFASIIGSVSGALITGFILMDSLSITDITSLNTFLGFSLSIVLIIGTNIKKRVQYVLLIGTLSAGLMCIAIGTISFNNLYEHLLYKRTISASDTFSQVIESRNGVLTVSQKNELSGGGATDGVFSIDIINDRNLIQRPYAISLFHPEPKEILMIGIGSGSWAQVKHITLNLKN
jgi:spermidine synthase